jgi:hypothetical protein
MPPFPPGVAEPSLHDRGPARVTMAVVRDLALPEETSSAWTDVALMTAADDRIIPAIPTASKAPARKRTGYDSVRAAMIHQHSTAQADRKIANAMNNMIEEPVRPAEQREESAPTRPRSVP